MTTNTHHTKLKGDIAVAAVIFDLTKKGYIISEPMSENAPYDLICDTGDKLLRIQVKYRENETVPFKTSWTDKNGVHSQEIDPTKIDYFALVNKDLKVCYPPTCLMACKIFFSYVDNQPVKRFKWWEDYLEFQTEVQKDRILTTDNTLIKDEFTEEYLIEVISKYTNHTATHKALKISRKQYLNLLEKFSIVPNYKID